jgi:GNAT superfamily N-acetyltransferase
VAISPELQRQGHGRVLASQVDGYARALGVNLLLVNVAHDAVGYYRKLGWKTHIWDLDEQQGFASDCTQMCRALSPG